MELTDLHRLAIALGLGLLVGLQREWAEKHMAGARTFPLITIFGALAGILARELGGWEVAAALLAVAAMIVIGNVINLRRQEADGGLTTEFAALVMFAVGVLLTLGYTAESLAVAGGVAVLLQWKAPVHRFVHHLSEADLRAVARLVLIGLVILPILPDRTFGPYDVLNPFQIWAMVVLIVGISLAAYAIYALTSERVGTLLAGILGGLISSTATTVAYARRARDDDRIAPVAALVVFIASTVVFGRVLFEVAVVAPELFSRTAPPLAAMAVFMCAVAVGAFLLAERGHRELPKQEPPSNLGAAILFGLLYAVVLFGAAAAKEHFGEAGLFSVAFLSGLTDMDAITLSTAQMMKSGRADPEIAWRIILVGALSNILFKSVVAAAIGSRRLFARVVGLFGMAAAGGLAIFFFWP